MPESMTQVALTNDIVIVAVVVVALGIVGLWLWGMLELRREFTKPGVKATGKW